MDLTSALASHADLGRLSQADRLHLESAFNVEEHPDGHVFIAEASKPTAAWLILDGEVSVTRARDPYVDELARLRAGDMFGLVSIVADLRRTATCFAAGPVTCARIERSTLEALMRDQAPIGIAVQRAVMRQLASDARIISRELRDVLQRRG